MATNAIKYISNVGKSVVYSTVDHIKNSNPAIMGFADTNNDVLKSSYDAITHIRRTATSTANKIMDSRYGDIAKKGFANIKEDIATGKFYNRERIDKVNTEAAHSMLGMDDDFDFNDDSFSVDDSSSSSISGLSSDDLDAVGERTSTAISSIIARTSEETMKANMKAQAMNAKERMFMFNKIHAGLGSINANITTLMQFATGPMQTHLDNSTKFYTTATDHFIKQTSLLEELVKMQKESMTPQAKRTSSSEKIGMYDILDSNGMPNLEMLGKRIMQNMKAMDSGMGDIVNMFFETGAMEAMIASPLQFATDLVAKKLIPKMVTDSMQSFNKSLTGLFPTMMAKLQNSKSTNPLVTVLKQLFDVSDYVPKSMNTGTYEKGKVPFDGITRKSIVEVIPTYLSKIYSALSGKEQDRYDYETGKFEKLSDIRKAFDDRYNKQHEMTSMDIKRYVMQVAKEMNLETDKGLNAQFKKELDAILAESYKRGMLFNPSSKDAKTYGLKGGEKSDVAFALISQIFRGIYDDKQLRNMVTEWQLNTANSKSSAASQLKAALANNDSYFTALFNQSEDLTTKVKKESKSKKDEEAASQKGLKGWISKQKSKNKNEKEDEYEYVLKSSYNAPTDNIMHNIYDEVKNIRVLLQSGNIGVGFIGNNAEQTQQALDVDSRSLKDKLSNMSPAQAAKHQARINSLKRKTYTNATVFSEELVKAAAKRVSEDNKPISLAEAILDEEEAPGFMKTIARWMQKAGTTKDGVTSPLKIVGYLFEKADDMLHTFMFGTNSSPDEDKENKVGIMGTIREGLKDTFSGFREWMEDEIFTPLAKMLEDGIGKKIVDKIGGKVKEFVDKFKTKAKDSLEGSPLDNFKQRFSDQVKRATAFGKDSIASVLGDLEITKKKTAEGKEKSRRNTLALKAASIIKNSGIGETEDIENAAAGMKRVSKTGVIAVSEGEMIIPADLNPYNIQKNMKDENKAKDKFTKTFGKFNIPNFAKGGTVKSLQEKAAEQIALEEEIAKQKWEKEQNDVRGIVDTFFANKGEKDAIKNLGKSVAGMSGKQRKYALEYANSQYKKLGKEDYVEGKDKGIFGKAMDIIFDSAQQAGEYIKEGVTGIVSDKKGQESEGRKFMSTAWDEIKKNVPEMAAGGAIGAGVSLLTGAIGGPLLGAAVGAGTTLLTNSDAVRGALFGKEVIDENGNKKFQKGLLPENFAKNIQKYVPSMAKGGVVGALASILPGVPGGPIAGLILGSAVGFASKNETLQKALFGDEETGKKGILPKDFMDRLKKALPKGVAGGILGAGASLLGGPFGLVSSIAVGSALGLATETDGFKKFMFGDKEKGEKGWLQKMGDHAIGKLKEAWDPLKKELQLLGKGFKDFFTGMINNFFKEHLGTPFDKIMKSISDHTKKFLGGFFKGLMMPITGLLKMPFNIIGGLGNRARAKHIARGQDDYDTAAQRLLFRKKHKRQIARFSPKANRFTRYDQQMADMDDEQIGGVLQNLQELQQANVDLNSDIGLENQMKDFRENISNNMNLGWRQTHKLAKGAYAAIEGEKDPTKIAEKMNRYIAGLDLSEEEKKKVSKSASGLFAAVDEKNKKRAEFGDKQQAAFENIANKFGFKVENADDLEKLTKLFQFEAKARGVNAEKSQEAEATDNLNDAEEKRHGEIVSEIGEIKKLLEDLKKNPDAEAISKKERELADQFRDVNELNPTIGIKAKRGVRATKAAIKGDIKENSRIRKLRRAALDESNTGIRNAVFGNKSIDHKADVDTRDLITGAMVDEDGNPITAAADEYNDAIKARSGKRIDRLATLLLGAKGIKDKVAGGAKKVATRVKYAFTSDAKPVRYIEDNSGKYTVDKSDAETSKTINAIENKEQEQKSLWSRITSIPSTLGRIFGFKKDDVEGTNDDSNEEGFLSKFIKKASVAAGLVVGAPLLTGVWIKDIWPKLKPILEPLGDKFKDAIGGLWNKFRGWLNGTPPEGESAENAEGATQYGLPGVLGVLKDRWEVGATYIMEEIVPGLIEKVLPRAVELTIRALPLIAEGAANGVKALAGMDMNSIKNGTKPSTKSDNVTYTEFNSEKNTANSEALIGERETVGGALVKKGGEAFVRGWGKGTIMGKVGRKLAKSKVAKLVTKPVGWALQGADAVVTGAGKLGNKLLYGGNAVNGMTKEAAEKAAAKAASKAERKAVKKAAQEAGETTWQKWMAKAAGKDTVDVVIGATGAGADDVVTATMKRSDALARGYDVAEMATKAQSKSSKLMTKIDDVARAAKSKVAGAMDTVSQKAMGMIDNIGNKGLLGKIVTHIKNAVTKLFSNKQVIAKFSQFMKVMGGVGKQGGKEIAEKVGKELAEKLAKHVSTKLAGKLAGAAAKLAGSAASAGLINIAFGVKGFIDGWKNTNDILGIAHSVREASILEKLISGIVGGINEFACLGLIPVGILVDLLLPILNKIPGINNYTEEIIEAREDSAAIVAQFNEENGTNLSVEEYNELIENGKQGAVSKFFKGDKAYIDENGKLRGATVDKDGKIKTTGKNSIFKRAEKGIKKGWGKFTGKVKEGWSKTKDVAKTGWTNFKGNVKEDWQKTKEAAKEGWNNAKEGWGKFTGGVKEKFDAAKEWVKNFSVKDLIDSVKTSLKQLVTARRDIDKFITSGDVKGLWDYKAKGEEDEDGKTSPVSGFVNAITFATKLLKTPQTLMFKAGRAIWKGIKNVASVVKNNVVAVAKNEIDIKKLAFNGDLKGLWNYNVADNEDSPVNGFVKGIAIINKVMNTPLALVVKGGKLLWGGLKKIGSAIKTNVSAVAENNTAIQELARQGDLSAVWNYNAADNEDSPVNGFTKATTFISKIMNTPMALVFKVGKAIGNFVKSKADPIKTDKESLDTLSDKLKELAKKGDVGAIWKEKLTLSDDNLLKPFFTVASTIQKIIYTITGTIDKIFNPLKEIVGNVKDKAKDIWNNVKDKAENTWDSVREFALGDDSETSGKGSRIFKGKGFISQRDPAISGKKFGNETIGEAGCAPASALMAASGSFDKAVNVAKKYQNSDGVSAGYFKDYFGQQGIASEYTGGSSDIKQNLMQGNNVVLGGQDISNTSKSRSPFGPNGHYVVANGMTKDGKYISINDPEASRPNILYPAKKVLSHTKVGVAAKGRGKGSFIGRGFTRLFRGGSTEATEQQVWSFLKEKGFSDESAAGVMGNIQQECSFNPTSVQDIPRSAGHGLFQWTNGRYDNLCKTASGMGTTWTDIDAQLSYFWKEFSSTETTWLSKAKNDCGGYEGFMKLTDVEAATTIFCNDFERAGTPMMDKRIQYAKEFYKKFTGNDAPIGGGSTGGTVIDKLLGVFDKLSAAYGLSELTGNSGSGADYGISGTTVTDPELAAKQKALVEKMYSVKGTLKYAQNNAKYPGSRNPEDGSGDCSSTVQWAYQNILGVDPGSWTGAQMSDSDTYTVPGAKGNLDSESKLQLGDLLLKDGHVEMYAGNGQMIGHGGGSDGKTLGPTVKSLPESGSTYHTVRRWTGFKGSGSGLNENSTIVRYAKGASNSTSHQSERNIQPGLSQSTKFVVNQSKTLANTSGYDIFANSSTTANTQPGINYTSHLNTIIRLLGNVVSNTALLEQMVTILTSILTIMSEEDQARKDNNQEKLRQLQGRKNMLLASLSSTSSQTNDEQIATLIKNAEKLARA